MARFAAGFPLGRLLVIGGLITAGWLLGVIYGVFGPAMSVVGMPAQPSAQGVAGSMLPDALSTAGSANSLTSSSSPISGSSLASSSGGKAKERSGRVGGFPTATKNASANAEAMAGRTVDGLTSQSKPLLPSSSAEDHVGDHGLVPQTSGESMVFGDIARSTFEPRFTKLPAPVAAVVPPVVRTAADDPSFSPD
ncbi:hypothetical protein [Sphaerimonospora thailandensis]|uniref:Uncharacterized protein n=1 Tax=Sphaerimonospora thailandensis TaxID=795644 RepID=A0A8J3RET7_9ACTN|nr:hypothetical protein [Sphaerimonospora thailandensis]GIH73529.1 hypothetical protein Mth01_57820 [Sphaerimonospora thailandensis]